jgi:hypothetical protein
MAFKPGSFIAGRPKGKDATTKVPGGRLKGGRSFSTGRKATTRNWLALKVQYILVPLGERIPS